MHAAIMATNRLTSDDVTIMAAEITNGIVIISVLHASTIRLSGLSISAVPITTVIKASTAITNVIITICFSSSVKINRQTGPNTALIVCVSLVAFSVATINDMTDVVHASLTTLPACQRVEGVSDEMVAKDGRTAVAMN